MTRMVELASTGLLIFLVATSLVMSALIWTGAAVRYRVIDVQDEVRPGVDPIAISDLKQLLEPDRIVVVTDQGATLFVPGFSGYDRLWEPVSTVIEQAGPLTARAVPSASRRIELILPCPVPTKLWDAAWNTRLADVSPGGMLSRIILDLGEHGEALKYVDSQGQMITVQSPGLPRTIIDQVRVLVDDIGDARLPEYVEAAGPVGAVSIADGIYVPVVPPALAPILTRSEILSSDETAAEFFADVAGLRRIEEGDRAIIYTDGQRAVRVFPDGSLEYTDAHVADEPTGDLVLALRMAAGFVREHGGLPPGAHLVGLHDGDSFQFQFTYRYRGLPVMGEHGAVLVQLQGATVVEYRRAVRIPLGAGDSPAPLRDWRELAARVASVPDGSGDAPVMITDIRLVYYNDNSSRLEPQLRPAWVFELSSGIVVGFDAYTGEGWQWIGLERRPF